MQNDKNNKDSGLPSFFKDVGLPNTTAEEVERNNSKANSSFIYSTLRNAIETVDDPDFHDKYSRMLPFYQRFSQYMHRKRAFAEIREQLEMADWGDEVRKQPNNIALFLNSVFLVGIYGCFKVFKRNSFRIVSIATLGLWKAHWMDFYTSETLLRRIALERDTPLAQEIRNLYRFYLPDDPDIPLMTQKCEDYKKVVEVKKVIKQNKNP